jgi:molecular chaperone GrpE
MSTKARHQEADHNANANNPTAEASPIEVVATDELNLAKVQEERDQYLNMLRSKQAEFENYQKRSAREAEVERKFCQRPLALEVIPALDNLNRFLSTVKEETELTKVVATVQKQLLDGLARQGIKRLDCVGKPFDPNQEEAIMQQPSDQPEGIVLMEVEAGYVYHDRVLRPAKVIVAKGKVAV